jgi:hypothetical protein
VRSGERGGHSTGPILPTYRLEKDECKYWCTVQLMDAGAYPAGSKIKGMMQVSLR